MQPVAVPYSRNPSGELQALRAQAHALEVRARQFEQVKSRLEGEVRQIDVRRGDLDRQKGEFIRQLAAVARTRLADEGQLRDVKARIQRLERSGVVR